MDSIAETRKPERATARMVTTMMLSVPLSLATRILTGREVASLVTCMLVINTGARLSRTHTSWAWHIGMPFAICACVTLLFEGAQALGWIALK